MGKLKLPYFYGHEAEQYAFYRIPKTLISDPRFRNISIDAKLLYGLMLDRMSLSMKNEWIDDLGRVYIYFVLDEIQDLLQCGHEKAVKLYLADNPGVERIVLCLDNDAPGRTTSAAIQKRLSEYEVIDNPPRSGKDYNDQLQMVKGISGRVRTRGGEAR